jgi:hypothetical protein
MPDMLTREDIIAGLRDVVAELHRRGETGGIRLVGGAALALRYFDRGITADVDAVHIVDGHDDVVADVVRLVARKRGWVPDWLNFEVTRIDALPLWGRSVEWVTLYAESGVIVEVASPDTLLVMKLRAGRRGRDSRDVRKLLGLCGITDLSLAERLYEDFYPGDALPDRSVTMVREIFAEGLPSVPEAVPLPDLTP